MADYDNTNRGSLFTNERKEKETHPDWTGNINVDGKDWRISAWKKVAKSGAKFISLSVSEPQNKSASPVKKDSGNDGW